MIMSCARVLSLAVIALSLVSQPAEGQLGSLRKRLEEKAREQLGKRDPQADTSSRAPAASPAPAQQGSGTAAASQPAPGQREMPRVAVYPGATLYIGTGGRQSCCKFHVQDSPEKVLAYYAPTLGPGMTMEQFEAKHPSTAPMMKAYRDARVKAWFIGEGEEMGGMVNMANVIQVIEMAPGRIEFDLPFRTLDSEAQMQHLTRFIREGLRILPAGADPGVSPPMAEDEEPNQDDEDVPLTQEVLDRYLRARAAEAAEERRQGQLFAQREPQLRRCLEELPRALHGIDGEFVQYYCGGGMAGMAGLPSAERVGAKAGGLRSYQFARLRELVVAYYLLRKDKGASSIRQKDWPMWKADAFAVLDRNWARIEEAHRKEGS